MSGLIVRQALRDRFETIRQMEIERLNKKLRGLSDGDRRSLEAITAHIVQAIISGPERALADNPPQPALEALVHLFALDTEASHSAPEPQLDQVRTRWSSTARRR